MTADGGLQEAANPNPITLAEMRPALMAWALGPFMEHGKHPELVFSFVFKLWHAYVRGLHRDESWPDTLFFVDVEDPVPTISESKATTASFACIEELGVTPPPASGWQDKPAPEGEQKSEWQVNPENRDWIYHTTDDMYFHLPSNSLWERREMECCDPKAEAHTYYRVDAVHLQALSMFAAALDSALVPMAWKAWVRYMRKKKDRHFGLSKPPASPHKGQNSRRKDQSGQGTSAKQGSRSQGGSARDSDTPQQTMSREASRGSRDKGADTEPPTKAPPAEPPPAEPPPAEEATTQAVSSDSSSRRSPASQQGWKPSLDVIPSQDALGEAEPAAESEKQPMTVPPDASDQKKDSGDEDVTKRGLMCFRCFGRSRSRHRPDPIKRPVESAAPPRTSKAEVVAAAPDTKPAKESSMSSAAVEWVRFNEGKDAADLKEVPKPCVDTVERHMRRLEQFLEIVRRNPQKLIDHVERRRADKTTLAFAML